MPAMYDDISRMRKRSKSRNDRLLFEFIIAYRQWFFVFAKGVCQRFRSKSSRARPEEGSTDECRMGRCSWRCYTT